jgi:hypothetical protein
MSARENPASTLSLAEVLERLAALEAKITKIACSHRAKEPVQLACYSIRQFCTAHNISDHLFYKLQRQGSAPKTMRVGARTLISVEAAAEWRRQCEAAENPAQEDTDEGSAKTGASEQKTSGGHA